jgi:hypothetical protein
MTDRFAATAAEDPAILVITPARDASVALYFDGLPETIRRRIRILLPAEAEAAPELFMGASLVILVRRFVNMGPIISRCGMLRIPLVYFVDDNVVQLSIEDVGWESYGAGKLRRLLRRRFAGVVCGSGPLAEFFRRKRLHPEVAEWRPALPADTPPLLAQPVPPSRFAFIGGSFRWRALRDTVLPALRAASAGRPVTLFLRGFRDRGLEAATVAQYRASGIALEPFPFELSYEAFQRRMREAAIDAVLHPAADTGNLAYKSFATVVAARAIGALPIVTREGPFVDLGKAEGVIALPDERRDWEAALRRLFAGPDPANALRARFDRHCRAAYTGAEGGAYLAEALDRYRPDAAMIAARRARWQKRRLPDALLRRLWRLRGH